MTKSSGLTRIDLIIFITLCYASTLLGISLASF